MPRALQIIAFCLYSAPLYYMAEKVLHVHTKPLYLRLLARLPVCKLLEQGRRDAGIAAYRVTLLLSIGAQMAERLSLFNLLKCLCRLQTLLNAARIPMCLSSGQHWLQCVWTADVCHWPIHWFPISNLKLPKEPNLSGISPSSPSAVLLFMPNCRCLPQLWLLLLLPWPFHSMALSMPLSEQSQAR